jgi:hypothetical protein
MYFLPKSKFSIKQAVEYAAWLTKEEVIQG